VNDPGPRALRGLFRRIPGAARALIAAAAAALALVIVFIVVRLRPGTVAGANPASPLLPVVSCSSLSGRDLTGPSEAATITSATTMTVNGWTACEVHGRLASGTHYEILLPVASWHGDYVQEGCGGYCGSITISPQPEAASGCVPATDGALVVASDDEGHQTASSTDGTWAAGDPRSRVVFGYTSEHEVAIVTQAVIATFYGRRPAFSYFDGCSDGGREALDLAQRYPTDFNGIIAGAPANNWAALAAELQTWLARSNTDAGGHQILPSEKLPALHRAVMTECADADGVIPDPRGCAFDPAAIGCPTGTDAATCLTPAQVNTARAEYQGPTDSHGRNLFDGGEPYGSELAWDGWLTQPARDPEAPLDTTAGQLALNYLKYMGYWTDPPASYTLWAGSTTRPIQT
jgi:Tannase and feruloyl esterase